MERHAVVGFEQDGAGERVVRLDCGHRLRAGSDSRIGGRLECPECADQPEPMGGEAACFAHLLGPSCGAPITGPASHWPGCPEAG